MKIIVDNRVVESTEKVTFEPDIVADKLAGNEVNAVTETGEFGDYYFTWMRNDKVRKADFDNLVKKEKETFYIPEFGPTPENANILKR